MKTLPENLAEIAARQIDECATLVYQHRDQVVGIYDARICFAAYCEVLSSLSAAMIKNKVYPKEVIAQLLVDMANDAIVRESKATICHIGLDDGSTRQ